MNILKKRRKNHIFKKRLLELVEQIPIAFSSYQTETGLVGEYCMSQNR